MRKKLISLLLIWAIAAPFLWWTATPVCAEEFILSPDQLLAPSDLAVLDKTGGTLEGNAYSVECNSEGKTAAIRYDKLGMGPSYAAANRYLLLDVYYKKASGTTEPYGISVIFRSNGIDVDDWTHIYAQSDSIKKPGSDPSYLPNRWETVEIDCQAALEYLSSNGLTQKQLQIMIPATTGSDRVYLGNIRFSDSKAAAEDENYLAVLQIANDGDRESLLKVLANDESAALLYASLSAKGAYLDEIAAGDASAETVADSLLAKKPDGEGFTADNFVPLFNQTVAEALFGAADADGKASVIENSRYSTVLDTASIVSGTAYALLCEKGLKNTLFDGLGDTGFADRLRENVILSALNNVEDETTMQAIIEENKETLSITFTAEYAAFSDEQKAALYEEMLLQTPYADYADAAAKFQAAYTDIKNTPPSYAFYLRRNRIMTASDLPTYEEADFGGKKNVMRWENTNAVPTKGIRYGGINMGTEYSSVNKTLLVDCYLDDGGAGTFSLSVVFRHVTNGDKWINGEPTSTRSSGNYPANEWVTVAIDCQVPLQYLVSNGYTLDQLQIAIPATTGSFYVGNVRFTDDEVPYEATRTYLLDRSRIVPKTDESPDLISYETVDFGGKQGVMRFSDIQAAETQAIRYDGLNINRGSVGTGGRLFVDCYLDDAQREEFGLTASFRQTTGGLWVNSEPVATRTSSVYPANRWVTVVIDCSAPLEYLESKGYSLKQLQIGLPSVRGDLYVGEVKFVGFAEAVSAELYEEDTPCEWKNGDLKVKVTFADDFTAREVTAYAVQYESEDQSLIASEIQTVRKVVASGENLEILMTVGNADGSGMKVMVFDSRNKPLGSAQVFGNVPENSLRAETDPDRAFYLNEIGYDGQSIRISGGENTGSPALVTVLVKKDDEVLFADQAREDENSGFVFAFLPQSSFAANGTPQTPSGVYTAYVSSDLSDEIEEARIGIADEASYEAAIAVINEGVREDIIALLSGEPEDASTLLQWVSLTANGLYTDEIPEHNMKQSIADRLISDKPDGGYTPENIRAIWNRAVTGLLFESADTEQKYAMLKNERYRAVFGTVSAGEKTDQILSDNRAKESVFEGASPYDADFAKKVTKNMILLALNSAENSTAIKDVIEENKAAIAITFEKDYASLRPDQMKRLYDSLLSAKPFSDYADIKNKFRTAYAAIKNASATAKPSSSSGGGGGGGGSGAPAVPTLRDPGNTETAEVSRFADVEPLSWGKHEIIVLTDRGIISGMSESIFAPDAPITREQFCKLIAAAYRIQGDTELPFADIDPDAWYTGAVKALYANQIIRGTSENAFGVGAPITRQDAAVILYRVIGTRLPKGTAEKSFNDAESISDYAKAEVSALSSAGIITGYEDNTFGPVNEITRREAAVILYRALESER